MDQSVTFKMGSFPVQTPLDARPDLGSQPCYGAPGDLRIKIGNFRPILAQSWLRNCQIADKRNIFICLNVSIYILVTVIHK